MADEAISPRDIGFRVDVLENARLVMTFVENKTWDEFENNNLLHDAVTYRLGIVGEASRNISDPVKDKLPSVPWPSIRAMRNVLFHDYHGVQLSKVWDVALHHAPVLVEAIEPFLTAHGIRKSDFTNDQDHPRA